MVRALLFVGAMLLGVAQVRAAAAEFCGDAAPDSGFAVERVWPVDCSTSTPLDALVYVAGAAAAPSAPGGGTLAVSVSCGGGALPGALEFVRGGSVALWRGEAAFAPHTEYTLTAQRMDANGQPSGAVRRSTFVTGESFMSPIDLRGELDVTSRSVQVPMQSCHYDACGEASCEDGEGQVERTRVSIYVPPLDGGLPAAQGDTFDTRYEVVAVFAEARANGHVFASKKQSFERLTHSMIELDIPVLPEAFEGCAQVTVSDLSGNTLELEPRCLTLTPPEDEDADAPVYARDFNGASDAEQVPELEEASAADGCNALSSGKANLPLMLAALLLLLARRRLPF